MEQEKKRKSIYRLPPCPSYDIEGTESWLESMAERGFFLSEEGWIDGALRFDSGEKKKVRYRLDAAPVSTGLFSSGSEPEREAVEIAAAAGWKYLRKYGQFYVYRTEKEDAPELNTDPAVQAMALDLVRKRERSNTFTFFFWVLIYPMLGLYGYPLMVLVVGLGTPVFLLSILVILLELYQHGRKLLHLRQLRKRLSSGEELTHHKPWEKRANLYRTVQLLSGIFAVVWAVLLIRFWGDDLTDAGKIPLEEYTGTIPCATMADMGIEGSFKLDKAGYGGSEIQVWSSFLAPTIVDLRQYGEVTLEDGRKVSGVVYIDYYETVSPWLAKELAREYQRYDRKNPWKEYSLIDLPDLGIDYAAAYETGFAWPYVVLVKDNKIMHIEFIQWGENEGMPLEEWAAFFALSMQ